MTHPKLLTHRDPDIWFQLWLLPRIFQETCPLVYARSQVSTAIAVVSICAHSRVLITQDHFFQQDLSTDISYHVAERV